MSDLVVVFIIGLVGSVHCVGMCGGFVLALAQGHDHAARLQLHQVLYYLGKTGTYALFGALAGGFGAVLGGLFAGVQNALSIALGVVLVGIGLGLVGVLRQIRPMARVPGMARLSAALGALLRRPSYGATLGLGALNGLLPCALVYGLLVKAAATGSVLGGALTMAVFGLSTIPALYLLALSGFLMRPLWRSRLNYVGGVLVIVLGLITVARGTPALGTALHHLHAGGPPAQVEQTVPHGEHPAGAHSVHHRH